MQSKYAGVAERARQAKAQGKPLKPLAQPRAVLLSVHSGSSAKPAGGKGSQKQKGSSKDKGAPKAVLEKLAVMLGAKVRQQPYSAGFDSVPESCACRCNLTLTSTHSHSASRPACVSLAFLSIAWLSANT